jgi:hypothetical protein
MPMHLEIAARVAGSEMPWKSWRGMYGASSRSISSAVSSMSSDATASARCSACVAPTIGADTTGLLRSQTRATRARETPRSVATWSVPSRRERVAVA